MLMWDDLPCKAIFFILRLIVRNIIADKLVQLHTDRGDVKIELFCESVPKTAEVKPQHVGQYLFDGKFYAQLANYYPFFTRIFLRYAHLPFMMALPSIGVYLVS